MSDPFVSVDTASAHEKALIIERLSRAPDAGTRVLVAFYRKRWIGPTETTYYLSYAKAIAHLVDNLISITIIRFSCGTPEKFLMQFDGKPYYNRPLQIFQYTSNLIRWWFPDDPIPDGIELQDEYGQRIEVIQL